MSIEKYLELSFDRAGIRDSEKRLKGLITEVAIDPLKSYQHELDEDFDRIEEIVRKRVAAVIAYWCQQKHEPARPAVDDMLSEITNIGKNDQPLSLFYQDQVKDGLYALEPVFHIDVPIAYQVPLDELEFALLVLEEKMELGGVMGVQVTGNPNPPQPGQHQQQTQEAQQIHEEDTDIVLTQQESIEKQPPQEINVDQLDIKAEEAWQLVYNLMGYESDYIQQKMLPRWKQYPETFQQDRRFLYNVFIQAVRNATGVQYIGGNHTFTDGQMTIDQLWTHYFRDLSQQVGPQLSVAQLTAAVDARWYRRVWDWVRGRSKNISPVWILALVIALFFDGLTTYVSLDQTPMDGALVWVFTALITALFQIADMLVINYRQREFESDALIAKYRAKVDQIANTLEGLSPISDSFVQLSMEKSQAQADWKAAEDNRKMARRGRYWSARIADINVIVTAYGFAYMFLNAQEPMYALYQQIDYIFIQQSWTNVNLWVFLMVGLAITVSFVINTAQRTEILGWSMRRLKNNA
jgi:hypothetical protein